MLKSYATLEDAVQCEIIAPIEATGIVKDARTAYDIDALAQILITLRDYPHGKSRFVCAVDEDPFWRVVSMWRTDTDATA